MATDTERRDVAERLRELDYSDLKESLICAYLDALGIKGYEDWVGIAHRLADLIDPGDTSQICRDTVACDREALLVEAEEAEKCAWYFALDHDEDELRDRLTEAVEDFSDMARRIREACGVVA